ncbi:MAG TPA: hypothetical protein VMV76_03960, partial [Dehalococcoidia bacterium]|nr:hypothetical protein [Dehalococcoidia bacterium]
FGIACLGCGGNNLRRPDVSYQSGVSGCRSLQMGKITGIAGFSGSGCVAVIPGTPYQSGLLQIRHHFPRI